MDLSSHLSSPSPLPLPLSFMDKLKKKDSNEDNTLIKTDIGLIKADLLSLREYMNTIIEQNKLLIENQDKIMDMLIK